MRSRGRCASLVLAACAAALASWQATPVSGATDASTASSPTWNRQAAASYLDSREVWWQEWPRAQKDHGTLCISCHTVVPYAMARPALRQELSETSMTPTEKTMFASVEKRVGMWSEMVPFYSDVNNGPGKTAEAHSTEAVLNAVILASYDAHQGHLRLITRTAFDAAWALQQKTGERAGGWLWQDFHLAPWESNQSAYQGAALLAVEVGKAPDGYANEPGVRPHVQRLSEYLRRQYASQPLVNQMYVLWASAKVPGLLSGAGHKEIIGRIQDLQQADGGWRFASLDQWKRLDNSPEPVESDGFATALAVLVLEESGNAPNDRTLKRGVAWLEQHQEKDGNWRASSPNKLRDPESDVGRFMSDAATGYAVLALENAH
jgi:squalene-hopene/tetraprenyl-beta-curcumene cyclase